MIRRFHGVGTGVVFFAIIACGRLAAQVIPAGTYTGVITGDTINTSVVYVDPGASFASSSLTLTSGAGVYWRQVGTLSGMTISQASGGYIYVSGANNALTLNSGTSVTGGVSIYADGSAGTSITNAGTINHTTGSGSIYSLNLTNSGAITATGGTLYLGNSSAGYNTTNTGTVTADGSSTTVYLRGNFDNNGTLTAQNSGILQWEGNNTTANLGSVVIATGGRVLLNGTIDNTAATLNAPAGGSLDLSSSGRINNGTVAAGALNFRYSGGTLSNVVYTGDLVLPTDPVYGTGYGTSVYLTNGTTFTGSNLTLANNSWLYWQQAGALTGKTVTMGNGAYIYVNGASNTLTLDSTTTVTGDANIYTDGSAGTAITNAGTINHTTGSGSIYSLNLTNSGAITATGGTLYLGNSSAGYNTTNTGTVTADGASTTVYLRGNFDNNGTLTAQNSGILQWEGNNTTANLGSVVIATGGRVLLNGTIDNTAATLNVPTGGSFDLSSSGRINNGTVAAGALNFRYYGGTLSNVVYTGDLVLPTDPVYGTGYGTSVYLTNGTTFTGSNLTLANNSWLYWQQAGALTGKTVTMGNGAYIYVNGASNTLTLDSTTTVTGTVSLYSDTSTGTAITNQGVLTHNSGTGYLYANTLVNQGSVAVNGGSLYFGYYAGHSSTIAAGGSLTLTGTSSVYVYSPLSNSGQVLVQSGTIYTNNNMFTNAATGLIGGAGTINGDLTMAGGTLAPGNSIGTLTFSSGDFAVTGSSVFAVEMDGTTADKLSFQNPTSTVDLGAGLLQLSISLLAAPTEGTTYTIMNIASGGSGYTGYFAGLPNSGDAMTVNFSGTDYTLNVYYLANSIMLQVPEPSTYALLGAGLALFALRLRRRRGC